MCELECNFNEMGNDLWEIVRVVVYCIMYCAKNWIRNNHQKTNKGTNKQIKVQTNKQYVEGFQIFLRIQHLHLNRDTKIEVSLFYSLSIIFLFSAKIKQWLLAG